MSILSQKSSLKSQKAVQGKVPEVYGWKDLRKR